MARISGKIERNRSPESVAAAPGAPAMRQAGAAIVTDTWATFTRDYGVFRAKQKQKQQNNILSSRKKSFFFKILKKKISMTFPNFFLDENVPTTFEIFGF